MVLLPKQLDRLASLGRQLNVALGLSHDPDSNAILVNTGKVVFTMNPEGGTITRISPNPDQGELPT